MHRNVLLGLLLFFASQGCRTSEAPVEDAAGSIDVDLQLNWYAEAEHGGYVAALVHGYYQQEGLNVRIKQGGPSVPVLAQVASGRAAFGVSNAHQVLLGHGQEANTVGVMAPLQNSPRCIMVHAESDVESFDDLHDMTLAVNSSSTFVLYLREKCDLTNVRFVPYSGNVSQFMQNGDFGQQAYVFSEPLVARRQGATPRTLLVSDLGFNPYSSILIANPETVQRRPDLVRRMVRASLRGWRKYLEDPSQTNAYLGKLNPDMDAQTLAEGARILHNLCVTKDTPLEQLGHMTEERWQRLLEQLIEVDALAPGQVDARAAFSIAFWEPE